MTNVMRDSRDQETECDQLVEEATAVAEMNHFELAAETFLEAAECFDQIGDRSRSARYLTAAAEFFEMLGNRRQSSRCYGKAILRHLLANEIDNAIVVLQKAHLLGVTQSMFNFLLARKNFEKRGIDVEKILDHAETNLAAEKIHEIKKQIEISKEIPITSEQKLEPRKSKLENTPTTPTVEERIQAKEEPKTIPPVELTVPELSLTSETDERLQPAEEILPELKNILQEIEISPFQEPEKQVISSITHTTEETGQLIGSFQEALVNSSLSEPIITDVKTFEIKTKNETLRSRISSNDFEAPLLLNISFNEIVELNPQEKNPIIHVEVKVKDSDEIIDRKLKAKDSGDLDKKSIPPVTFSIKHDSKMMKIKSLSPSIITETVLSEKKISTARLQDVTTRSFERKFPDIEEEIGRKPVVEELTLADDPINYINIQEIIPETTKDLLIPELIITTSVPLQWEILDVTTKGSITSAEITDRKLTPEGELITWKISDVETRKPIKIKYTLRRRFQRIIYWRVGNKIHSATMYHSILRENDKWRAALSFVNTQSAIIQEILIEDILPPELIVEHVKTTLNQDPKIIIRDGLTTFQWYQRKLDPGDKIIFEYELAERPLCYHFIDDFIERFTGQKIRVEKIVEPRTHRKDLHYFVLYRITSSASQKIDVTITDYYPPEFALEKYSPDWERCKWTEEENKKVLQWIPRNEGESLKKLLLVIKGSPNFSPVAPIIEFASRKITETKDIEKKITKKIIDLKQFFGN